MNEYRCPECGRLLFKSDAPSGTVQTVCKPCKAIRTYPVALKANAAHNIRK